MYKEDVGMGLLQSCVHVYSHCIACLSCTLPFVHLVSVDFGIMIPISPYIIRKCISYSYEFHQLHFPPRKVLTVV